MTELGTTYYNMGRIKIAQKYLARSIKYTARKAQNHYFQGLIASINKKAKKSRYHFIIASSVADPYGTLAGFELAVYWFNNGNDLKAFKWVDFYLKRDPRGIHHKQARKMLASLQNKKKSFKAKGVKRPDPDLAKFKYNKWSLFNNPHYYYAGVGHGYRQFDGFSPSSPGTIQPAGDATFGLTTQLGLGFGPISSKYTSGIFGYSYEQNYETNFDRLIEYFTDPFDFTFFPYRLDLLERRHRFLGEFNAHYERYVFSLYAEIEFIRIGSTASDFKNTEIEGAVSRVADRTIIRPEFGVNFSESFTANFHLLFLKHVSEETPQFSYQTFNFSDEFLDFQDQISFGLDLNYVNEKYKIFLNVDLFRYSITVNDIWRDKARFGGQFQIGHELIPDFNIAIFYGFYQDIYRLDVISTTGCDFIAMEEGADNTPSAPSDSGPFCTRDDIGNLIGLEALYDISQSTRMALRLGIRNNSSLIQLHDRQNLQIQFELSWAFPSHKPVAKLTDKFVNDLYLIEDF